MSDIKLRYYYPNLGDKFLLKIATFEDNSPAPLLPNSLKMKDGSKEKVKMEAKRSSPRKKKNPIFLKVGLRLKNGES